MVVTTGKCHGTWWAEASDAAKHPTTHRTAPTTKIQPKILIVLRSKNSSLEIGRRYSLNPDAVENEIMPGALAATIPVHATWPCGCPT